MPRRVEFNGRVHEFPDDVTDEEIAAALEEADAEGPPAAPSAAAPQRGPPLPGRLGPDPEAARRAVAESAYFRQVLRNSQPFAGGYIAQPLVNMTLDPERRRQFGQSLRHTARGVYDNLRQVPSLDLPQLGRDTLEAGGDAVENLPETAGNIVRNLPQLARAATYGPFEDEENAQRRLDMARLTGDAGGVQEAAGEANAATGGVALNTVGAGAGSFIRTPLQAAGFAAAVDAPFALSRGEGSLQERLPDALTEMGGAAAFGGTLQAAPGIVSTALERAPRIRFPSPGDVVRRFDRAGVDPSLAGIEGGGITGAMTKVVGDNFLAGGAVRRRLQEQATQVRDTAARIGQGYGRARNAEGAGRVAQAGVQRFATDRNVPNPLPSAPPHQAPTREWSFASKARALYDSVLEPIIDNPAALTNTLGALDDLAQRSNNPAVRQFTTTPIMRRFELLARGLGRGARDSFEPAGADDVAAIVTEINNARSAAAGRGEQTLTSWLRKRGVRDDRGDLRSMDISGRGASAALRGSGQNLDDLTVAAWEDGFFPGENPPTLREFMDAVDADARDPGAVMRAAAGGADTTRQAREILNQWERAGVDTSASGPALQRSVRAFIGADETAAAGAPIVMKDLRELRRTLREAQETPGLGQSVDNAALQRLEAALTRDIFDAAGPVAADLRKVDAFYRRGRQRIDNVLREVTNADPAEVLPTIQRWASPRGDTRALTTLRNALKEDEWRTVAASLIEHMGKPTAGASGFTAQLDFSLQRFVTAYRAMTPQARRIVFGSRGGSGGQAGARANLLGQELDNLVEVASRLKGVEGMANFSGSATHLQNAASYTALGSVVASGGASLAPVAAAIGSMGLFGELMTNPAAVRWLTRAPKVGASLPQRRRWLADLAEIAARDPALVPLYNELARPLDSGSSPADGGSPYRSRQPQPAQ